MQTIITVQTGIGPAQARASWQGAALAVHAPIAGPKRGRWAITHTASGKAAGHFNGPVAEARKLASLWDAAFETIDPDALARWPFVHQWRDIIRGRRPIAPPSVELPPIPRQPSPPIAATLANRQGRKVRNHAGQWQMQWRGQWWECPADAELETWSIDSCCDTPDGRTVEPDHPEAWLVLLGLV